MTDKTQPTPTASTMQTYYLSDNEHNFEPVIVPFTLTNNQYPFVITAPDASIQSPKYNWDTNQWEEAGTVAQNPLLSDLQKQIATLTQQLSTANASSTQLQQAITDLTAKVNALSTTPVAPAQPATTPTATTTPAK